MTQSGGVTMSARREVEPGRGKGGYDAHWADADLTGLKYEENPRG
jgi:hypothetical protein